MNGSDLGHRRPGLPDLVSALASCRVFDLEQMRHREAPSHPAHAPAYNYTMHRHHTPGGPEPRSSAAGFIYASDHAGTHVDALCHQAENLVLYGGLDSGGGVQTPWGFRQLGIETVAPILGRGVLLDVARHLGVEFLPGTHRIRQSDLEACAVAQSVEIRAGDTVLVRTGSGTLAETRPELYLQAAGIGADGSQWLADIGVRAVGADNVAWDPATAEIDPTTGTTLPGHVILLVRHGIHILENLFLEELAEAGHHEFAFICVPLKLRGATGSPVRPLALVP